MGGDVQKSDTATVPVLVVLAIVLFTGAYVAGEMIVLRVLKQDANHVVRSWRDFVAERIDADLRLSAPPAPPSATTAESELINFANSDNHLTRVRSANILDLQGRRVDGVPYPQPFAFQSPRDRFTFERMTASRSLEYVMLEPMASEGTQTIYYIPIVRDGAVVGGVRLNVDQTLSAGLLRDAFQSTIVLTLAVTGIGLGAALFVLWRRIRESWKAEDEIRFLALHDMLTGLPNRTQFNHQLEKALEAADTKGTSVGVICIDVDNFKDINDTLGHPTGDAMLRSVAKRILSSSGPTSLVSRLSGDEFAVIVEGVNSRTALENVARRYLRTIAIPHEIDDHDLTSSISLGLALAPEDGADAETILKNADLALYQAKAAGRNTYRFFTDEMDRDLRWRRRIEEEMRRAIGTDQFKVHYQPQFALHTGELSGFEALLRWNHPELGQIPPSTFIPIAEDSGMIAALGEWVLRTACRTALDWPETIALAVNLSVAQFRAGDVAELIEQVLDDTGLPVERLEVEITETLLLHSTDMALATLERLHALGVRIALDDFGTGYSSLSYLSRFPLDKIKIDRSFVQRMTQDSNTAAIVEAIITLAHALDATVTAEGVETHEQASILRQAGCHQVQGFLFGRPQETADIAAPAVVRQQDELRRAVG